MRNLYRLVLMLIAIISMNTHVFAQCDPVLRADSSQWIFNSTVLSSARVGSTLYVGGSFTTVGKNIGTLVSVDPFTANPVNLGSWPRVNNTVFMVIPDGSNGIIIAGSFNTIGGVTRNGIAQINSAGQVTSWDPNANGTVTALYRVGTTIYAGGVFTTIGGQTRNHIAALSLSTGLATSWNPNSNGNVNVIIANTTGTVIYAGGTFATIGGQSRNNLAAIDATTGLATSWNPNANNTVNALLLNGTTLYAGGTFSSIGGQTRNYAGAVSTTTGLATGWNPNPNNAVQDMLLNGGNIMVGGLFTNIGSQARVAFAEVDGTLGNATSLNYSIPFGQVNRIRSSGNDLYLGGSFTMSTGQVNLVKINKALSSIVASWDCNLTGGVVYGMDFNSTRLFVGGSFTQYIKARNRIAAFDAVTDTLRAWNPAVSASVMAIAANSSSVYIGGNFSTVAGATRSNFAEIDATTGLATTFAPNPNGSVTTLLLNGSTLYMGGNFTSVSSSARNRAAAFTSGAITSWNPNLNGTVNAMIVSGSDMILGGSFTTVGGTTTRNRIAAVSLSTATVTGWNPNADGIVNTLALNGSLVYAGGAFNNIGGQFRPRLAALDVSTGNATSWQPYPNGTINSIAINGNKMYVGGSYTNNGGQSRSNLSAVDLSAGSATNWDPQANSTVNHIGIYSGRLLAGGSFTSISAMPYPYGVQYNLLETAPSVTITGRSTICASSSVTYTATTDVAGASYQWKRNGLNVGTNSATYTVTPANNDQIQVVITAPAGCYSPLTATSNTITVSVVSSVNPTASISGNSTVCAGTSTTYTATINVPNVYYVWRVNGNIASSGYTATSLTYTPANGDFLYVQVYTPQEGCFSSTSVISNIINVTVNTPVAPTISISTPSTSVCAGASVTFSSSSNVTGGTYQWKLNGGNITGATNSSYVTTTLVNNDAISATITIPSGGCFTSSTATSNSIAMTVNANVVPTLTIAGNTSPCSGSSTTYTATTNVVSPTYQWKRNSVNVGTNSATLNIIPAANDVITCVVITPAGSCYTATSVTSNSLTIIPMSLITSAATVTGSTNLCQGSSGTYTVATNIVNGNYQWRVNSINVGTNNSSFSYTPNNNDVVNCIVTTPVGQGCYTANSVTSNSITVTVNTPVAPTITIATNPVGTTTVCSSTQVTFNVASTNVTGGTYQWKVNGFNIVGATSNTLNYVPSNNNIITCVVTIPSGGCFTASTATSAGITMTVTPSVTPTASISASTNNICAGTSVNYTATTNVVGGNYQWKVNGLNVGTNSATHNYTPANGDVVACVVSVPGTGCYTVSSVTSNSITMAVQTPATPTVSVAASATTVCAGTTVTFTATVNVPGVFYQWKVNGVNVGTNSATFSYQPANNDIILCIITTPAGCFTTNIASSTIIIMKVNVPIAHNFSIGGPGIAEVASTVNLGSSIQAGITPYSIEWKLNGVHLATTNTSTTSYTKTLGIDTVVATITPADACYAVTTSTPIYIYSVSTGVNDIDKDAISVYPNPFSDQVIVKGLKAGDNVLLYDMSGRKLQSWKAEKGQQENTFHVTDLPGGSYMIRITNKDNVTKTSLPLQKL